jgi:rhomboid protease GluP
MLFGLTLRYRGGIDPRIRDLVRQWVIYGIIFGVVVGADNAAHIGGLLMGMAFGYLLPPKQYRAQSRLADTLWTGGAVLACIATAASFALAGHFFFTVTA